MIIPHLRLVLNKYKSFIEKTGELWKQDNSSIFLNHLLSTIEEDVLNPKSQINTFERNFNDFFERYNNNAVIRRAYYTAGVEVLKDNNLDELFYRCLNGEEDVQVELSDLKFRYWNLHRVYSFTIKHDIPIEEFSVRNLQTLERNYNQPNTLYDAIFNYIKAYYKSKFLYFFLRYYLEEDLIVSASILDPTSESASLIKALYDPKVNEFNYNIRWDKTTKPLFPDAGVELYSELIKNNFISEITTIITFMQFLKGEKMSTKIFWTGTRGDIAHFIKHLFVSSELYEFPYQKQYQVIAIAFEAFIKPRERIGQDNVVSKPIVISNARSIKKSKNTDLLIEIVNKFIGKIGTPISKTK